MPTHLDLCSGIGGFALAAHWAGYMTIGFCEIDPFCQRVLKKHWPETPIHDDLTTLDAGTVRGWLAEVERSHTNTIGSRQQSEWDSVEVGQQPSIRRSARREPAPSDSPRSWVLSLLTAGYPCQPFSQAGKRLGEEDDRHLWPYIAALVADLRPAQCLFENVAGHITLGLDRVLADLEAIGYATGAVVVPACAVNAPHRRDRVWVMAQSDAVRRNGRSDHEGQESAERGRIAESGQSPTHTDIESQPIVSLNDRPGRGQLGTRVVADSDDTGQREQRRAVPSVAEHATAQLGDWWAVEPAVGRVAHGVSRRVDRLRSLGNAIVPQVAFEIISAMKAA